MKNSLCTAFLICSIILHVEAQLKLTLVTSAINTPVCIRNAGDARMFIVDQAGQIRIIDSAGKLLPLPFLDVSKKVKFKDEQGLLGLAFDPDFKKNGYFYINYTRKPDGATCISRLRLTGNPNHCDSTTERVLLSIYQPYTNHNGGHIVFGPDNYLYIGMGDGGSGGDPDRQGQNIDTLLGKILRIDVSDTSVAYKIPAGNPFVSSKGKDEIWDYGVRNPWGINFDRLTGEMWIADVGQNTYEEIDIEPAHSKGGYNYGWRCYEGDAVYSNKGCDPKATYTFPIYSYSHLDSNCSITGGYRYRGAQSASFWGKYFYSDYCTGQIHYLTQVGPDSFISTKTRTRLPDVVAFGEDRYGELYVSTIGGHSVYKISDTSCKPVAYITDLDTIRLKCGDSLRLRTPYGEGLSYMWMRNGAAVATDFSFRPSETGIYTVKVSRSASCTNISAPVYVSFPEVSLIIPGDTFCTTDKIQKLSGFPSGGSFSGPGVAGDTFSPVAAGSGYHQIKYTFTDTSGCSISATDSVYVQICSGIGEEKPLFGQLRLYPNPNHSAFTVELNTVHTGPLNLTVTNSLGQKIYEYETRLLPKQYSIPVELKNAPPGMYFLHLLGEAGTAVKSFVIRY